MICDWTLDQKEEVIEDVWGHLRGLKTNCLLENCIVIKFTFSECDNCSRGDCSWSKEIYAEVFRDEVHQCLQ